jgi:hypothetical protein
MKNLSNNLEEKDIVDILSDLKHRVMPRPFERLALKGKKDIIGVEIGVFEATHALSLLENLDIKKLYLVDPYAIYDDYLEVNTHYSEDLSTPSDTKEVAYNKLKKYKDKIIWIEEFSDKAVDYIPDNLDFVYIDGNHQEEYVRLDIESYFDKVCKGGVIGGHDFYNGYMRDHDGVVMAVTKYIIENSLPLQVELPDWWIKKL